MNQQESQSDRNLERLIHASCGPETRLTPLARERLLQRLSAPVREKRRQEEFPVGILALLSGIVCLFAVASIFSLLNAIVRLPQSFGSIPVGLLVLLNLVCLPIASLVIILRRKSCLGA